MSEAIPARTAPDQYEERDFSRGRFDEAVERVSSDPA